MIFNNTIKYGELKEILCKKSFYNDKLNNSVIFNILNEHNIEWNSKIILYYIKI